jgi:hypothetical protein
MPRACKDDVGPDREPEGVVADEGDLDEHADDRKDHKDQREHESKIHCASPLRCDETPIIVPIDRQRTRARSRQWGGAGSKTVPDMHGPR